MEAQFINPFIKATTNVLNTMAGVSPLKKPAYVKKGTQSFGDVSGIMGLAGPNTRGSFAVSFTEPCILHIVSKMFGEDITEMSGDIADAVGEITNMISGGARADLEFQGHSFQMAIPTVVSGKKHSIAHVTQHPVIVVPFETVAGSFFLEACLMVGK